MKLALCSPLAVALAVSTASAQPKHRRASGPLAIELAPPEARAAADQRLAARRRAAADKPLSSDRYLDALAKAADFRDSTIRKLRALVANTPATHPERPEILYRLAEAYAAKERFHRLRGSTRRGRERAAHEQAARSAQRSAIATFAALAGDRRHAGYPKMDRALLAYAQALRHAGRPELSLAISRTLLRRYPQSPLVGYAHLAFAEHHFERGELAAADRFYQAVLAAPTLVVADYARYKRGWVKMNLGDFRGALEIFYDAARRAGRDSDIGRRAAADFTRAFAHVGKPRVALAAFRRVDPGRALDLLERLAMHYVDMGKHAAAIDTLRELVSHRPESAAVCEWQLQIQRSMLAIGTKDQVAAETLALVKLLRATARRRAADPATGAARAACRDDVQLATGELAKLWHYEGDKTHDERVHELAASLYRAYLAAFPDATDATRMRFHLGDLEWRRAERSGHVAAALRRWRASARVFDALVKRRRGSPELLREAAYAAVLAWLNALRLDPSTRPPDPGYARPRRRPIRGDQAALLASLERYIAAVPRVTDPALVDQRVDIELLGARVLWQHDHLDEALPRLRAVVTAHPRHRAAEVAANMILDALIRLDDADDLARAAAAMAASEALVDGRVALAARLRTVEIASARKRAERLEKRGRWLECGEAYLAIARRYRDADGLDEILFNAATCYYRARSIGYALSLWRQLRAELPDSKLAERALLRLGKASSQIASYDKAAGYFEEYARRYAGEDDAAAALSDAVTYRRALGDHRAAVADIEYFVKTYRTRRPAEAGAALFGLASIRRSLGDRGGERRALERFVSIAAKASGLERQIAAEARLAQLLWDAACPALRGDGLCVKTRSRSAARSAASVCGGVERTQVTAIRRDPRGVARARRHVKRALELGRRGAALAALEPDERAVASYWLGAARMILADAELETFLAHELPELDFDARRPATRAASLRAFGRWMRQAGALGDAADERYRAILRGDNAAHAIAAAGRMGSIPAVIADAVYRVGIPRWVAADADATDAYCAELERQTAPLERRAVSAFELCLREAINRGVDRRLARQCEAELGRLRPREHPGDREVVGAPERAGPIVDAVGLAEL